MLALCYLRAILRFCPDMQPVLIPRTQAMYHDTGMHGAIASASAIRAALLQDAAADISGVIPSPCVPLMPRQEHTVHYLTNDALTPFVSYGLYHMHNLDLSAIYDISGDLANRIQKQTFLIRSYDSLIQTLKTRQYTYTRISRSILHLLLDMRQDIFCQAKEAGYALYVRLLGFRHEASPLIRFQKQHCGVPFIQKVSEAASMLQTDQTASALFQADLHAHQLYRLAWFTKYQETLPSDYEQNAIIR